MNNVVVHGTGWHVDVRGAGQPVREQIESELGGYVAVGSDAPARSERLGTAEVCLDPDRFDHWARRTVGTRYHDLVISFPSRRERRRFGRLTVVDGLEVVHGTSTGSMYVVDPYARSVSILHTDRVRAGRDLRRLIRDQLYIPWAQVHNGIVVHSAAFADPRGGGTLVVAPAGGGKTTFFLAALAAKRYLMLSGERTVVTRHGPDLLLTACPELVNVFPGSVAAYPQTAHLAADRDRCRDWHAAQKFHVPWRTLFECFGGRPAAAPVLLKRIVVPRFGAPWSARPMSAHELQKTLALETLSAGDPLSLPNWLGWYRREGADSETLRLLGTVPAIAVTWNDVGAVNRFLTDWDDDAS
jgi:hypothetical protein